MTELDYYIKKLQELEPRGEWKDVFSNNFEKIYEFVYQSLFLRRNYYINELRNMADSLLDLPFTLNDDERLSFRKNQKHLIDLLYLIKAENKKIFIVHGQDTSMADKISATLGRMKLDYIALEFESKEERNVQNFIEIAKTCDYAIVALTADDAARSLSTEGEVSNRSSQNAWFQFGYFLAQIGRKNILIAHSDRAKVDTPIDLDNFDSFIMDKSQAWKSAMLEHMSKNGIYIEEELKNKIIQ